MTEVTADGCALVSYSRYLPKSQIFRPIFAVSPAASHLGHDVQSQTVVMSLQT